MQCIVYAIAVPSSTCFRFFLRHLDTSCWLPMNYDMTCSSSRTWAYMLVSIPCSPGNSKGEAGWRSCHSWFCEVRQVRHAVGSLSVRSSSFISSPGRLDLLVKSRSLSASGYEPDPLVSRCCCSDRHCGRIFLHAWHIILLPYVVKIIADHPTQICEEWWCFWETGHYDHLGRPEGHCKGLWHSQLGDDREMT